MKKVLILVLSHLSPPYASLMRVSRETWDSVDIDGVQTIFYLGKVEFPADPKVLTTSAEDTFFNMGRKDLDAFQWAIDNSDFDFIARVNSSCYVNKKMLLEYCQTLPTENMMSGVECAHQSGGTYLWGGTQYIISRDAIQKILDHKDKWNHELMEDEAMCLVSKEAGIDWHKAMRSCSIDKANNGWTLISYGGKSVSFKEFSELKDDEHVFFRVKYDSDRKKDLWIMRELFKSLK